MRSPRAPRIAAISTPPSAETARSSFEPRKSGQIGAYSSEPTKRRFVEECVVEGASRMRTCLFSLHCRENSLKCREIRRYCLPIVVCLQRLTTNHPLPAYREKYEGLQGRAGVNCRERQRASAREDCEGRKRKAPEMDTALWISSSRCCRQLHPCVDRYRRLAFTGGIGSDFHAQPRRGGLLILFFVRVRVTLSIL